MKKIEEKDFEKKLAEAPKDVSLFITGLYVDPTLEQMIGEDTEDYLVIVNELANQIAYFILGLLTIQEFKDNLAEVLYLEGVVEVQKAYDAINKFVISKLNTKEGMNIEENKIEDAKLADLAHISHHDLLSEIENPTPSIKTTASFQANLGANIVKTTTPVTAQTNPTTTQKNPTNTSTITSLHSPEPVAPYTNPALNIAAKLDQKLSTPSASIPKDIYVSKKPDPYHEPVNL
ncbi:MAG: hypothetical protein K9M11_03670 [Candidatus Pacebacteria bacterium]|nr:hypothetical protein [Candidatus Paceibacterota bacterium]